MKGERLVPRWRSERHRNLRRTLIREQSPHRISGNDSPVHFRIGSRISCQERFRSRTSSSASNCPETGIRPLIYHLPCANDTAGRWNRASLLVQAVEERLCVFQVGGF